LVAAGTRNTPLLGRRRGELQQFTQRYGAGLVHRRTSSHLDRLQIETARLTALLENDAQQLVYFARDLLPDRFRRFFSSGERLSSTGRKRQIFSFTSSKS
jgi:hypothetical protein